MTPATRSATTVDHPRWLRPAVHRLAGELRRHHQPTADHSHRLARAARRLAERLRLDPLDATEAELVAIVHDVGKLAIPPDLLDRRGAITEAERETLRGHAVAGADILAQHAGLEHLAVPVRHVHEAWDGSGYPDGLVGEGIPRLARIVCVVDAYDAMANHRAYRRALSADEARMRLAVNAGRQFDPALVRAYLDELHDERERRFGSGRRAPEPPSPLL
jgi:HD-GYP domain-containing protein (c-di-GMP phosphodiesterase class II)